MGATITGKRTWFSGLSNVQCQLVFTTERIIVARTVGQMSDPLGNATYGVTTDAERLKGLDVERILKSDEKNFSIQYAEIIKVEVGRKWRNPEPTCPPKLGSTGSCGHGQRNWKMLKLRFASSCRRTLAYKESTSWTNVSTLFASGSLRH